MNEKSYKKYAWIIFLIIGIAILITSIPHALGFNTDPDLVEYISGETIDTLRSSNSKAYILYNFYFSGGGLSDLGFAFFIILISITAYRKGQVWSWYAFWIVPVYFVSWIALSLNLTPKASSSLIPPLVLFTFLSFMGLLLPFRQFFPKKNKAKF